MQPSQTENEHRTANTQEQSDAGNCQRGIALKLLQHMAMAQVPPRLIRRHNDNASLKHEYKSWHILNMAVALRRGRHKARTRILQTLSGPLIENNLNPWPLHAVLPSVHDSACFFCLPVTSLDKEPVVAPEPCQSVWISPLGLKTAPPNQDPDIRRT